MTAAPQPAVLRTIFVHPRLPASAVASGPLPTHRLLKDLGHSVTSTDSFNRAMDQMAAELIDLLIVEAPEAAGREFASEVTRSIASLPADQQPLDIAVITNQPNTTGRRELTGPRMHLLLKPLHVHGLLHVLRNLTHDT